MKFKYSVGEKVLCFEPDETKARVLYNAKIMDADITKDVKGKKGRTATNNAFFKGWNHAWDRWADESFVLKDDEQNRKLQKKLARRAFKKLKLQKGRRRHLPGVGNKQEGTGFVDIDSSSGESMDSDITTSTSTKGRLSESEDLSMSDKSFSTNNAGTTVLTENPSEDATLPRDEYHFRRLVTVDIPQSLKQRLEEDHTMINRRNMVVHLPVRPNVVQILENYVKKFAIHYVGAAEKQKFTVAGTGQLLGQDHILPPEKRLNLCQEMCCDLKLLFDYALPLVLLYLPERDQYKHVMKNTKFCTASLEPKSPADLKVHVAADTDDQSTRIIESRHYEGDRSANPCLQVDLPSSTGSRTPRSLSESSDVQINQDQPRPKKKNAEAQLIEETHKYLIPNQPNLDQTGLSKDSFGRRRSSRLSHHESGSPHKSSAGDEPHSSSLVPSDHRKKEILDDNQLSKQPEYSVTIEPCTFLRAPKLNRHSTMNSDGSACSSAILRQPLYNANPRMDRESYISASGSDIKNMKELKKIWDWCIVPPDYEPEEGASVPSSHVYGIHHLLRLFVKLPDILTKMEIPEFKMKVISKHINALLKFLGEYERELFEIDAYVPVVTT